MTGQEQQYAVHAGNVADLIAEALQEAADHDPTGRSWYGTGHPAGGADRTTFGPDGWAISPLGWILAQTISEFADREIIRALGGRGPLSMWDHGDNPARLSDGRRIIAPDPQVHEAIRAACQTPFADQFRADASHVDRLVAPTEASGPARSSKSVLAHRALLAELSLATGFDVDFDEAAITTACASGEVTTWIDAAYSLAAVTVRAYFTGIGTEAAHDLIRGLDLGDVETEAHQLAEVVTARSEATGLLERRTRTFQTACENLHRTGLSLLIDEPDPDTTAPAPDGDSATASAPCVVEVSYLGPDTRTLYGPLDRQTADILAAHLRAELEPDQRDGPTRPHVTVVALTAPSTAP